jgi:hypothetical protein
MPGFYPPPRRSIILTKDIENITGYKSQAARRLLNKIRKMLNKPPKSLVSIREFCSCTSLDEQFVREFIL